MVLSMKDFPTCFGENGIQVADSSSSSSSSSSSNKPENLVKCIYKCQSRGFHGFVTLIWIKPQLMGGPVLTIMIENSSSEHLCKVDIKPWLMLSKRRGNKTLAVDSTSTVEIRWDFSYAKFGSSPEPLEPFYLTIVLNRELLLHIGDTEDEPSKNIYSVSRAILVAKREHMTGKRCYTSRAQLVDRGTSHNIKVEYDPSEIYDKCLVIIVDDKPVLQVMRLKWKFRGNHTISVDGIEVEVYWDVHNWIFGGGGNAIFLFTTRGSRDKLWVDPVLTWPGLKRSKEEESHGFSLALCAWRNE